MRKTIAAMTAAFGIAGALTTAPIASANQQQDFLSYLDNNGVYYSSAANALNTGKLLCRVGRTPNLAPQAMEYQIFDVLYAGGFPNFRDGGRVLEASTYMCPDIGPRLDAMFDGLERNDASPLP